MGTSFGCSDYRDLLDGKVLVMIGRCYSRKPLANHKQSLWTEPISGIIAPNACTHSPCSFRREERSFDTHMTYTFYVLELFSKAPDIIMPHAKSVNKVLYKPSLVHTSLAPNVFFSFIVKINYCCTSILFIKGWTVKQSGFFSRLVYQNATRRRVRVGLHARVHPRIFRVSPQSHSSFSASLQTFRLTVHASLTTL